MKTCRSIFAFLCLSLLWLIQPVLADSSTLSAAEGLTISPPLFDLQLKPGDISRHTIRVTNPTKNLIELYPSAVNFQAAGDGGQPNFDFDGNESKFSLAKWITFSQPKIALQPNQVVDFQFQITIPADAEPGGHYGSVFLGTQSLEKEQNGAQVALTSMVGSLTLVKIPGDIKEKAVIEEFTTPWFYTKTPVSFNTFIRNTGNVHFKPDGEVTIRDWRGLDVQRIALNPTRGNILPDSRRKFDVAWEPDASHFWKIPVGRFSATLRVAYGQQQQVVEQQLQFWIVPWWATITAAIILFLIFIFIIWRFRRRKKKALALAAKKQTVYPAYAPFPEHPQPSPAPHQPIMTQPPYQAQPPYHGIPSQPVPLRKTMPISHNDYYIDHRSSHAQPPYPPRPIPPVQQHPHVFQPPVQPPRKPVQTHRQLSPQELHIKKLLEKQTKR